MEFEKLQGIIAEVLNIEPEEVTMAGAILGGPGGGPFKWQLRS